MQFSNLSIDKGGTQEHLLIDASIYIFQYYFSLPDHWFSRRDDWPTAAVYGYTTFLITLLKNTRPKRIAACFDESLESCFRNDIYSDYKASRALPDEALAFQLHACRQVSNLLGIKTFASDRYEADDLIGSLYQTLTRSKRPIAILTRDKDLGQLIRRAQDCLWDYSAKSKNNLIKGIRHYSGDITDKFGVHPAQLADYLALVGDSIDDIPGVPGIGAKTAATLLQHFDTVEHLISGCDEIVSLDIRGKKSIAQKIRENHEQVIMAKRLATIIVDLKLIKGVNDLNRLEPDWSSLEKFCNEMGFPKLYSRIKTLKE